MTTVPRCWPGSTVVCLGGGPSLTVDDVACCRGRARVIAVNNAYQLAPWADVLYACDRKWWDWHQGVPSFTGPKYSLRADVTQWPDVQVLRDGGDTGLELDPQGLRTGSNSGYQAINLAVHLGARRIVLLGYDMAPDPHQRSHWFGEHPNQQPPPYDVFLRKFATIVEPLRALGVEVVNASRQTQLTIFPRVSLEEALASLTQAVA